MPRPEDREKLVKDVHLQGHFQARSNLLKLAEKYYWPSMERDIKRVIGQCETCHRNNRKVKESQVVKNLPLGGLFERIGMDLVFGLPESRNGYIGILVITDHLTKYPWCAPMKGKTAGEVAKNLLQFISQFGPPGSILSDQGTEFVNQVIETLCAALCVERQVTSAYHPETNGLVERFNGTLITALRKAAEKFPQDWPEFLPWVLMAYRGRVHSSTGFQPYELVYGKKMKWWSDKPQEEIQDKDLVEESLMMKEKLEEIRKQAKELNQERQWRMNQVRHEIIALKRFPLKEGDVVYREMNIVKDKLSPKYEGPFEIVGKTKNGNYCIRDLNGIMWHESVPLDRLKKVDSDSENPFENRDRKLEGGNC